MKNLELLLNQTSTKTFQLALETDQQANLIILQEDNQ